MVIDHFKANYFKAEHFIAIKGQDDSGISAVSEITLDAFSSVSTGQVESSRAAGRSTRRRIPIYKPIDVDTPRQIAARRKRNAAYMVLMA